MAWGHRQDRIGGLRDLSTGFGGRGLYRERVRCVGQEQPEQLYTDVCDDDWDRCEGGSLADFRLRGRMVFRLGSSNV